MGAGMKLRCVNHPDRRPAALCEKYERGYCSECFDRGLYCADPELYCKFRPLCLIWDDHREKKLQEKREAASG